MSDSIAISASLSVNFPIQELYASREELRTALESYALQQGFILSTHRPRINSVEYACKFSGPYNRLHLS